ncbi:MAG: hypothetical protein K2J38_00250, partial [Muribaculaceae bacterium]|nr:hypothetical protein [Muribaculaceae bacterium]
AMGALGAAVFAVVAVIGHFSSKADKAAESAKKLSRCTDAYVSGAAEAKTGITGEINTLKELIKTNGDTADVVRHLNETYGDIFGTYRTAAEWMDTLIAKSKDYIRYKGYEAQALAISQKIAEAEQRQVAAQDIKDDLQKTGVDSRGRRKQKTPAGEVWRKVDGWDENEKTLNEAREDVSRLTAEYDRLIAKTEDWRTKLSARKTPPKSDPQAGSGTEVKVPEGSIAELEKQLSDIRSRIRLEVDADSRAALYRELCSIEDQKRHIEFSYKYPDFKPSELPEVDQVQLNVETDIAKYQPELEDTSDWVESIGDKSKDMAATAGNAFNQLGGAISGLGNALEIPELNVAGTMAQAIATMVSGFAAATAEGAALGPFGWMAVAASGLAQLTAMVSAVKGLPAFADGGIVSGPTVGLIGEYAGASNNPEVVAPLNKLNSMLKPSGTPVIVGGTLRVSGRDLICVLANETRVASKSGRRTNIKL